MVTDPLQRPADVLDVPEGVDDPAAGAFDGFDEGDVVFVGGLEQRVGCGLRWVGGLLCCLHEL